MSCFILSETDNYIPVDFWNNIKVEKTDATNIEISNTNDIQTHIKNKKIGNGFFVNINNNFYIISCYHIINNNDMANNIFTCYYYDDNDRLQKMGLKVEMHFEELDIIVFKTNKNLDDMASIKTTKYYDNKLFEINGDKNAYINTLIYNDRIGEIEGTRINIKIIGIKEKKIISQITNQFELPYINFTITTKNQEINGLSGSLIYNDDKPFGIVMCADGKNSDNIYAIPVCLIINMVKHYLNTDTTNLKTVFFENDFCKFYPDENTKYFDEKYKEIFRDGIFCIQIINTFDLTYEIANKKNKFSFYNDDVILLINNIKINDDKKIYDENIGCCISINVFIMLSIYYNNFVKFTYLRDDKIDECCICGIDINKIFNYNISFTNKHIKFHDLIFIEMSEELLKYNNDNGIIICHDLDVFNKKKDFKYVCLVNYSTKVLMVLNKVSNENVINLNSLCDIFNKKKTNKIITLNFNRTNKKNKINTKEHKINDTTFKLIF